MNSRILTLFASLVLIATLAPAAGCFRERKSVTQVDSLAKIRFTGETRGALYHVEKDRAPLGAPVPIDPSTSYEIAPGAYEIVVTRDGAVVVKRRLLLADGQTVEIRVP